MTNVNSACEQLFPLGFNLVTSGEMIYGEAKTSKGVVALLGTINSAPIGVDLAFALAGKVLEIIQNYPQRPIIILVDTQGQNLSRRDELLGNAGYLAHLSMCFELARMRGHTLISIVYKEAVSGGYLALGMIADRSFALDSAQIRVMALSAMSRIMQISLERLEELCASSPIFGPGASNYVALGALDAVLANDLSSPIEQALSQSEQLDQRAKLGLERGGRKLAFEVINLVINAHV
jgi:malonate decarboxylase gamma subunit